ncbi:chemotaxis protein CheX [Nocardioides sp.]|uniref:chemotaxis protein CheX n=1 Tax=Nocardioides sp. TaxID=35761 RepID=UPI002732E7EB|nr:chemotaxis protein CheX [Nocardioides sp.]MDP3890235.1 chemotaxis protein CheX [Nocardioides sp.]
MTTTTLPTGPTLADLLAVTEEVWASFLGSDEPLLPGGPGDDVHDGWSASVTVSGGWEAMVTIELPVVAADLVTRTMLAIDDPADVADEDVADAVGELVNMVGGNVKSLMAGPSTLSLPVVAAGRVARSSETTEVARADLLWAGSPVRVTVTVAGPASPTDRSPSAVYPEGDPR